MGSGSACTEPTGTSRSCLDRSHREGSSVASGQNNAQQLIFLGQRSRSTGSDLAVPLDDLLPLVAGNANANSDRKIRSRNALYCRGWLDWPYPAEAEVSEFTT